MQSGPLHADNELTETRALPNGAAAVTGAAIDVGNSANGDFKADCEAKISAPALVVGDLANTETMVYDLITSDASDLGTPTTLVAGAITQTGAGGAGAAAATWQGKLPNDVLRYIGIRATNSGAGDASDKIATLQLVF